MIDIQKVEDISKTMKSLDGFHPVLCVKCKCKEKFDVKLFILSSRPNTAEEFESVRKDIAKHGVQDFGVYNTGRRSILTAAVCGKCGSENVIWDYCDDCEWVKRHL